MMFAVLPEGGGGGGGPPPTYVEGNVLEIVVTGSNDLPILEGQEIAIRMKVKNVGTKSGSFNLYPYIDYSSVGSISSPYLSPGATGWVKLVSSSLYLTRGTHQVNKIKIFDRYYHDDSVYSGKVFSVIFNHNKQTGGPNTYGRQSLATAVYSFSPTFYGSSHYIAQFGVSTGAQSYGDYRIGEIKIKYELLPNHWEWGCNWPWGAQKTNNGDLITYRMSQGNDGNDGNMLHVDDVSSEPATEAGAMAMSLVIGEVASEATIGAAVALGATGVGTLFTIGLLTHTAVHFGIYALTTLYTHYDEDATGGCDYRAEMHVKYKNTPEMAKRYYQGGLSNGQAAYGQALSERPEMINDAISLGSVNAFSHWTVPMTNVNPTNPDTATFLHPDYKIKISASVSYYELVTSWYGGGGTAITYVNSWVHKHTTTETMYIDNSFLNAV
jgi:hypothetical protein